MTRYGGATRGGQMEVLPDKRWQRTRGNTKPAGADKRHERKDGDLAESEAMMG
jgi:hypothetical protein